MAPKAGKLWQLLKKQGAALPGIGDLQGFVDAS